MNAIPTVDLAQRTADLLERIRVTTPRVHCLMNTVVQKLVADGLSAIGAIPSMTSSIEEIDGFVRKADALTVNLGTLDVQRREVIGLGLDIAADRDLPWVLDPAHCDYSPPRAAFAQKLLERAPSVLRANASEFALLDRPMSLVGIRTGKTDLVTDGVRALGIETGHPLMAKVTGTGCLSGALIAAFLAVEGDAFLAGAAAMLAIGIAAEIAGQTAKGPGSFEPALLDALFLLDGETILKMGRVSDAES